MIYINSAAVFTKHELKKQPLLYSCCSVCFNLHLFDGFDCFQEKVGFVCGVPVWWHVLPLVIYHRLNRALQLVPRSCKVPIMAEVVSFLLQSWVMDEEPTSRPNHWILFCVLRACFDKLQLNNYICWLVLDYLSDTVYFLDTCVRLRTGNFFFSFPKNAVKVLMAMGVGTIPKYCLPPTGPQWPDSFIWWAFFHFSKLFRISRTS